MGKREGDGGGHGRELKFSRTVPSQGPGIRAGLINLVDVEMLTPATAPSTLACCCLDPNLTTTPVPLQQRSSPLLDTSASLPCSQDAVTNLLYTQLASLQMAHLHPCPVAAQSLPTHHMPSLQHCTHPAFLQQTGRQNTHLAFLR